MSPLRPALLLAAALALAVPAEAQAPLTLVNDSTTVRSVSFEFADTQTLLVADLELQIATTAPPGFIAGFFTSDEGPHPLLPVEVAKDAVRLTQYYEASGFPQASVDYAVELDTTENRAAVTFEITEGPALRVGEVTFAGPGQAPVAPELVPEIREDWEGFTERPAVRPGDRIDALALIQLRSQTVAWLRNRGYAWADAGAEQFVDSTGLRADVRVKVNTGPRVRVREVRVEGAESPSERVVTREIPVRPGSVFDASALAEGQREIFALGLFQLALVEVAPEAVRGDTLVDVLVRLRRGPARIVNAFGGYYSDGGLTVRGSVTHRNAFGGARQVSLDLEARTGIGGVGGRSVSGGPVTDYRASLAFRQPYVLDRRLSYSLQPSYRVRDDEIESSSQVEVANTLLLTLAPLKTAALSVTGRRRDLSRGLGIRLLDAGQFALPPGPFLPDSLTSTTGVVGLDGTYGTLDDPLQPRRGFVLRPSLAVAGGDVAYARARLAGSLTVPVTRRVGVVARATVGGLRPLGGTTDEDVGDYILLRDQLFYAGGTNDVRGWAAARLGPKTFSVTPPTETPGQIPDPSRITSPRDVNYVGVGGRLKGSGSVQLNLPLPFGPQWGAVAFVDAGGVFSPALAATAGLVRAGGAPADSVLADLLENEGGIRFGTGAGIQYLTPVGFVSFAIGVKVNPSYFDERDAALVYCGSSIYADDPTCFGGAEIDNPGPDAARGYIDARLNGSTFDPEAIEPGSVLSRIQFHLSIGQTF